MATGTQGAAAKFDDEDYPAYTMGRAAEMLGVDALRHNAEMHGNP